MPKNVIEISSKTVKKVTTVSKTVHFWKSTNVTDNGAKKVARYFYIAVLPNSGGA